MEATGMDVTNNVLRIAPEDRKWERTGFEGVQICVMRTNDDRGATVLLKAASGAGFPAHSHPGGGELLVISGRVIVGGQVLSEGDYLWTPPGGVHDLECEEDALLFVNAPQGTKIVD
jgi:quercetin dioxygenase-like cupin family protein